MFTHHELEQIAAKGITLAVIEDQLNSFKTGFPFLKIEASASIGNGILAIDPTQESYYTQLWDSYLEGDRTIVKFVPASGAASRMFKNLFEFLSASYDTPQTKFEQTFFDSITSFAFYQDLDEVCVRNNQANIAQLIAEGNYKAVVANLLEDRGLNYGTQPKGMLKFHNYGETNRTAMEEHLVEGALYASAGDSKVNVHFTVSHDHLPFFKQRVAEVQASYEVQYGVKYNITFSEQKPSTDTIAANMDNSPFADGDKLLFRPAGHGALIENLNDIEADVVFVKNIDNVVPDNFKADTVRYKKIIGGVLVEAQAKAFGYISLLESGQYTMDQLREVIDFVQHTLMVRNHEIKHLEDADLVLYLLDKLKRPMRVCGMVKNVGEPGGGPFVAYNPDGTTSLQILESSQIDMSNEQAKASFENSTHFNPVDLVCAVKDAKGQPYTLPNFVDKSTGFISIKSKGGKELKALELPGLWNGAMSNWNTLFVEVPIATFNPVKTVNDLLRDQHQ